MAEWKLEIKALADDFFISQVVVNKILKRVESMYEQREREIPKFYKGNQDEYLYDTAHRELMSIVLA